MKKGDTFMIKGNRSIFPYMATAKLDALAEHLVPVQMFLVDGEDIKIGSYVGKNYVTWINNDYDILGRGLGVGRVMNTEPRLLVKWNDITCVDHSRQLVNVIGKMTDDVNEGEEFDENDIEIWNKIHRNKWTIERINNHPLKTSDSYNHFYIKIKGPCGHFH